jgi:hypothetical protein
LLALIAALLVTTGCFGGSDDTAAPEGDGAPLSDVELGWVRGYSAWTYDVVDEEFGSRAAPGVVSACERRLEQVGPPPTERLRAGAEMAATVCPLLGVEGARRRAYDAVYDSDDLVLPLLLDEQPLELRDGVTDSSRADSSLSSVASGELDDPVEVRCWSDDDWKRLVAEDNAWTEDDASADDLVGWADETKERIHMRLSDCNALARLGAASVSEWTGDERETAADALETLAHEIQHFESPDADEAAIECAAMRSMARLGGRLGLDSETAMALAEVYRTEIYPGLSEEYTSGDCQA